MTSDRVYMRHIRAADLCSAGARTWWADHGLDWSDFLDNGLDADTLLRTGDPLAERVVRIAREENVE